MSIDTSEKGLETSIADYLEHKISWVVIPHWFGKGILDNIDMDSYRLQLEATTNILMEQGEDLKPIPTEMRGGTSDAEIDRLSNILQTFDDR